MNFDNCNRLGDGLIFWSFREETPKTPNKHLRKNNNYLNIFLLII